jgi:ComF family protein
MSSPIQSLARTIITGLVDLALPRVCLLCEALLDQQPGMVCEVCWRDAVPMPGPHCRRCSHPTYSTECRWCALLPDFVIAARSAYWVPEGTAGAMVHKLKYDGWTGVAADMARCVAREPVDWCDVAHARLVPVPLGAARLRERGFNQSRVLASAIAAHWRIPVIDCAVERTRETRSQVLLTAGERSANVHGAFAAGSAAKEVRGAHVVLVDDVVTTAATLNACAAALVACGAASISYITFGRARAAFDRKPYPRTSRSNSRWQSASASTASAVSAARSSAPPRSAASTTSTSSPSTI